MVIDRNEYLNYIKKLLDNVPLFPYFSEETANKRIKHGGERIIDLLIELEKKGFLKKLNKKQKLEINKNIRNALGNIISMTDNIISQKLTTFAKGYKGMTDNEFFKHFNKIKIIDKDNNEYTIPLKYTIINNGFLYSSLCELIKDFLVKIIDFKKMCGREPIGIGDLIKILESKKIENLSFLGIIDTGIRNSFSHFDFKIKKYKIYCENNTEKKYITISYLNLLLIFLSVDVGILLWTVLYLIKNNP